MSRVSRKLTAQHEQVLTCHLTDALQTNQNAQGQGHDVP